MILDWFRRSEKKALTYDQYVWMIPTSSTGVAVGPETALRSPVSLACFRLLVDSISSIPIHVYERTADGGKKRATDHPAEKLLSGFSAPWESSETLRRKLTGDAILRGDGVAVATKVRDEVREIHRLDPGAVRIECSPSGEPRYTVTMAGGGTREYGWREIVHIPAVFNGGHSSKAIIDLCREAIGLDITMAQYQAKLFANGAKPGGYLKAPAGKQPLSAVAVERLRNDWNNQHQGVENAGGTAILEGGYEFEQLSLSAVDAQFLELRRLAIEDITRGYGVPPVLVGVLDRAVWRNVEQLAQAWLTFGLRPWLNTWQSALERVLLTPKERETLFIEFLVDDLVRADVAARSESYFRAVGGPWLTPDEVRAADNLPPIAGGSTLRAPLNTAPATSKPKEESAE